MADVARPLRAVFFEATSEVQRLEWREAPASLCFHGGDCEAASERSGSGGFHPVRWRVVLQRHFGIGSRIAVALLVWCGLFFSRVPVDAGHGGRFRRQL